LGIYTYLLTYLLTYHIGVFMYRQTQYLFFVADVGYKAPKKRPERPNYGRE